LIVSVHITKTAGHTFNSLLEKWYGKNKILYDYEEGRIGLNSNNVPLNTRGKEVVHGHFKATLYEGTRITWVRDPVKQVLGLYGHAVIRFKLQGYSFTNADFYRFLINYEHLFQNVTTKYFDGLTLDDFAFVGIVEDWDNSIKRFCKTFDLPELQKVNRNINGNKRYLDFIRRLDSRVYSTIETYCSKDIELYKEACRRFKVV
jgi:hypothetical protein